MAVRLGRYEVLKHLASGGMADVLLGRTDGIEGFERHVVLKRIKPEHAQDLRFIRMFLDEARLAANLHHQHIVQVHDIGEAGGEYFIAMEYLHAEDVRAILLTAGRSRQHVPLGYAMAIVSAAAAGLHYAHERRGPDKRPLGIVHRDVSPSNILVGYDGSIKIVDFGIAKASARQETRSSNLKGKISYMSPEQCKSAEIDRRSDVYSLGIVLYELATTTRLFKGTNDYLVMDQIVNGRVPPPQARRPDLPAELSAIIMRAIAPDPERRFATADDLRRAIDQIAEKLGLTASSSAIAAYMRQQFGEKPEPWLDLGAPLAAPLEAPGSTGSQPGGAWTELWRSDSLPGGSVPARASGSPLGSGLVPRASGPIGTGVGNAGPRSADDPREKARESPLESVLEGLLELNEPRDAARGGVNRPAVPDEGGRESPPWIDEPRDAARGGVNRPAVPDEGGRESPPWINEPDDPTRRGMSRADVPGEGGRESLPWINEPDDPTRRGMSRPDVPGEGGRESPPWINEPDDPTRRGMSRADVPGEGGRESLPWINESDDPTRRGMSRPDVPGEWGRESPESPLLINDPSVLPQPDMWPSTAPTDARMGSETKWPAQAGISARSNVIAAAIAVPLFVAIGFGIWWFAGTDALPVHAIQVKPVAAIPPIEELTKLAVPAPVPEASDEAVPAQAPTAPAAAQAHSPETATGSSAKGSHRGNPASAAESAVPPLAQEPPAPGSRRSPPVPAKSAAHPTLRAPAASAASAPFAPGSAARGLPAAPPAAASPGAAPTAASASPRGVDAPPVLLSRAAVERVASQHGRERSKCDGGEALHGEITVRFSVDPAGKVSKTTLATTLRKPGVAACILRSVQAWQFPPQGEPGAVGTYTLSFR